MTTYRRRALKAASLATIVVLSLMVLSLKAVAATRYVNLNNPTPTPPYTSWETAATNIQNAVDLAVANDEILVTNGVYQTGARALYGMSNRLAVTKPVTVRSVNGPALTQIMGYQVPGTTNGPAAVRCVYLTNGAALVGFTLTNGATEGPSIYDPAKQHGGGVWCEGSDAVVSNCVLTGNSALSGGGVYQGTLNNCVFIRNWAHDYGGGAHWSTLNRCTLSGNSTSFIGGGTSYATLNNCTLTGNWAPAYAGGAYGGILDQCTLTGNSSQEGGGAMNATLNNCALIGNSAAYGGGAEYGTLNDCILTSNSASYGGGAYLSTLNNCTLRSNTAQVYRGGGAYGGNLNNCLLVGNSAGSFGGGIAEGTLTNCTIVGNSAADGGGVWHSVLWNCIVYYNSAPYFANYDGYALNYCCATPMPPAGAGNLTNAPLFLDTNSWSNLRLQTGSPCINTGNNVYALGDTDMDGRPRVVIGHVDLGAYEYQGLGVGEFIGWLDQYGLPTDGSADQSDSDSDSHTTWQEWIAGTDPTNADSTLRMLSLSAAGSGMVATWSSISNRAYSLERATHLGTPTVFSLVRSNLAGLDGSTSFTDTNAAGSGPFFYRVRVER